MRLSTSTLLRLCGLVFALMGAFEAMAQIGPPPPPGGGVPIDGGASILLAAGAAYGARKLYRASKDKQQGPQA